MCQRLDVVDQRRPPEISHLRGERRPEPRHRPAALHRLEHRRFLARDVRARSDHELERAPVEEPRDPELLDCVQQPTLRCRVLLAQVDVSLFGLGEAHRDQDALDEEVRPKLHDVAVLDRPRLTLVRVDDDVARSGLARDRLPLDARREPGAAEAGDARSLELSDDRGLSQASLAGARARLAPRSRRGSRRGGRARSPGRRSSNASPRGRSRRLSSVRARGRSGRDRRPRSRRDVARADRERRSSRTRAPCRCGARPPVPAGTNRRTRPRAPLRAGCSCGRRGRPKARE